jgi:glyoxylase-like metal-dependent hydrolase (beta-lactamase superfamily II)
MSDAVCIPVPLVYLGSVNVWLLEGDPVTLIDTGPATPEALASLEEQLATRGLALEDIELVLLTHHHLDHTGLAAEIKARSGAQIAAHHGTASWGARLDDAVRDERRFTLALIDAHGVPQPVRERTGAFFEHVVAQSRPFATDRVLVDGQRVRAGGRDLRIVSRPGHSTTDTLFVDEAADEAFVGDHLLATITTGVELGQTELPGERRRGLMEYLGNLRKTQVMPLRRCYAGHGPVIDDHAALIDDRIGFHADRLERIAGHVEDGCDTAFEVARRLWSDDVAEANPVLVVWEVLGHLDLLVNRGVVTERVDDQGRHRFLTRHRAAR